MDDGAVRAISGLQKEINEKTNDLELGFTKDRRPDCINANTLNSLGEYLKNNPDDVEPIKCIVVCSLDKVILYSEVRGATNNRHKIMEVQPVQFDKLTTGRLIPQEEMIIELLTRCVRTEVIDELVMKISSMTYVENVDSNDNGVSTDLMMSAKVLCNNGKPDRIIHLQPYRVFPEIEQPESPYLIRVDSVGKAPHAALFIADGGMWKVGAIKNITNYLTTILPEEVSIIS